MKCPTCQEIVHAPWCPEVQKTEWLICPACGKKADLNTTTNSINCYHCEYFSPNRYATANQAIKYKERKE